MPSGSRLTFHVLRLAFTLVASLLIVFWPAGPASAEPAPPWTVFTPADSSLPMSPNSLSNAGFENGPPGSANDWWAYGSGYTVDESGGRGGGRALQVINPVATDTHGAYQRLDLDQTEPKPLYFSAWSKAEDVSGEVNSDYSLYLDVYYTDGTPLWGQVLRFDTGSHDWQFREGFIAPAKPIAHVYAYCLLRRTHSGTAWFDDLTVQEVQADVLTFDSTQVATSPPDPPPFGGAPLTLTTGDGLSLTFAADGGAITDVGLDGNSVQDPDHAYASGFFVRDVAAQSDFVHVGGSLTQAGDTVAHQGGIAPLSLDFTATYTATADRIAVHAELSDTSGGERAVTLYFAVPITTDGWTWGDDIRTSREVEGLTEFANFYWHSDLGATGYLSKYPWASLSGPSGGIALGVPLDCPRLFRLIHNPITNQFYAAFDLGLSPMTDRFPSRASVDLVLYRFDGEWGFRAAAQGYYDRFPEAFARRIPPGQEGIWVAFSDLSPITDTADFGIAFHELGSLSQVAFDDSARILSFRYIAEPWSHWLPINDPGVDPDDYDQVMAYLHDQHQNGAAWERDRAEATLSSGFFDEDDRYRYESTVAPWCSGVAGCAVFTLNPDPDVSDPTYPLNKAHLEWNQDARETYTTTPGLDGEYVDSFLSRATVLDLREAHFAAADTPLTYRNSDHRLGLPEVFATTEFARWLTQDVHQSLGKWSMANGILIDLPWGANLFDFTGQETDWLRSGSFVPDSDARMNYRRTLSYQRPYGLLMNTDFDDLSYELVERYFQVCLFYGLYPSMFSHNAATERYWDDPSLYNRDRPLFRRYIPLIRRLNAAGWQPVTQAQTSDPAVYVERFGDWPHLHFTLRNTLEMTVTVGITVEAEALGLPAVPITATAFLAGEQYPLSLPGPTRTLTVTLAPQASELLHLAWAKADLDGDCDVDIADIMLVASRWHTSVGDPDHDPLYDMDGDGNMDIVDIMLVAMHWGETCPPESGALVWAAGNTRKVLPTDPVEEANYVWSGADRSIGIKAARNEHEPFQLIIATEGDPLSGVNVTASDLIGRGGTISQDNITLYRQTTFEVTQPSDPWGTGLPTAVIPPGRIPDALIPFDDPYDPGHAVGAPFATSAGENQPIWVDVYVPADAPPGKYSGTLTITADGGATVLDTVALNLTVWDFALPETTTLDANFPLDIFWTLPPQYEINEGNEAALYALTDKHYEALLDHRLHPFELYRRPACSESDGTVQLDFSASDPQYQYFLDTRGMVSFNLPGVYDEKDERYVIRDADGKRYRTAAFDDPVFTDKAAQYYQLLHDHYTARGWFTSTLRQAQDSAELSTSDRHFTFFTDETERVSDEPLNNGPDGLQRLLDWASLVKGVSPDFKVAAASVYPIPPGPPGRGWVDLAGYVDEWEIAPDEVEQDPETYRQRVALGERLGLYFNDYGDFIDYKATLHRALGSLAYKYDATVLVGWAVAAWVGDANSMNVINPWLAPPDPVFGNGAGALFWPGHKIEGDPAVNVDGPLPSLRLELAREAAEDYEYLTMLAAQTSGAGSAELAEAFARSLVINLLPQPLHDADPDREDFYALHDLMGAILSAQHPVYLATIQGTVTESGSSAPLAGVLVSNGQGAALTDGHGTYTLAVEAGDQTLTASRDRYTPPQQAVNVGAGTTLTVDFALERVAEEHTLLFSFETTGKVADWEFENVISQGRSSQHATEGTQSLKVVFDDSDWATMGTWRFPTDWSNYTALELDVYNESDYYTGFYVGVGDDAGGWYPLTSGDILLLPNASKHVVVPIAEMAQDIDVSHVDWLEFEPGTLYEEENYKGQTETYPLGPRTLYFDNLRLVRVTGP